MNLVNKYSEEISILKNNDIEKNNILFVKCTNSEGVIIDLLKIDYEIMYINLKISSDQNICLNTNKHTNTKDEIRLLYTLSSNGDIFHIKCHMDSFLKIPIIGRLDSDINKFSNKNFIRESKIFFRYGKFNREIKNYLNKKEKDFFKTKNNLESLLSDIKPRKDKIKDILS